MPEYIRKPAIVEAFQMTIERRKNHTDWPGWLRDAWGKPRGTRGAVWSMYADDAGELEPLAISIEDGSSFVSCMVRWGHWIIRHETAILNYAILSILQRTTRENHE